jgi:NAD-dependent deacetylase
MAVKQVAGFVSKAKSCFVICFQINFRPSDSALLFDERRYGVASDMVPTWVGALLNTTNTKLRP